MTNLQIQRIDDPHHPLRTPVKCLSEKILFLVVPGLHDHYPVLYLYKLEIIPLDLTLLERFSLNNSNDIQMASQNFYTSETESLRWKFLVRFLY